MTNEKPEKRKRSGRNSGKKFDWSKGKQTKPEGLPIGKNGIPQQGERKPREKVFPGED